MDKFNETAYKNAYAKEKYTPCKLMLKLEELAQIEEYRQILGLSKMLSLFGAPFIVRKMTSELKNCPKYRQKSEFTFCILRSPLYYNTF